MTKSDHEHDWHMFKDNAKRGSRSGGTHGPSVKYVVGWKVTWVCPCGARKDVFYDYDSDGGDEE